MSRQELVDLLQRAIQRAPHVTPDRLAPAIELVQTAVQFMECNIDTAFIKGSKMVTHDFNSPKAPKRQLFISRPSSRADLNSLLE